MADTGQLATQDFRSKSTQEHRSHPAAPKVTSVANPRRIRLTRLSQDASRSH
jgi:hypothetical protein